MDGSVIDLRGFTNDPGAERLKSDSIVAGLVDEAAHMSKPDSLVALRGRCLETGGRLWLASLALQDTCRQVGFGFVQSKCRTA